jgi:hypothetical protein
MDSRPRSLEFGSASSRCMRVRPASRAYMYIYIYMCVCAHLSECMRRHPSAALTDHLRRPLQPGRRVSCRRGTARQTDLRPVRVRVRETERQGGDGLWWPWCRSSLSSSKRESGLGMQTKPVFSPWSKHPHIKQSQPERSPFLRLRSRSRSKKSGVEMLKGKLEMILSLGGGASGVLSGLAAAIVWCVS